MIAPHLYAAFVASVMVLLLIPGPNVALIAANSLAHGRKFGLLTVVGTASAMLVHLVVVAFGLTALLGLLGVWFGWLRWIGALYLIYLGVRLWRAPALDAVQAEAKSVRVIWLRGFLVGLSNPKVLFFYGAFFPQFLDRGHPIGPQVALLCGTIVALTVPVDCGWALVAASTKSLFKGRLANRLSGGVLAGAGAALALARK